MLTVTFLSFQTDRPCQTVFAILFASFGGISVVETFSFNFSSVYSKIGGCPKFGNLAHITLRLGLQGKKLV